MTYPHVPNDQADDPFASAMAPQEITYSNDVYGQIDFDMYYCVLQKGVGKVVYDPGMHAPGQRRTAVSVVITDIGGNTFKRDFIAEIPTDGWLGVTLPSLKALGVQDVRTISGHYVHAEMVKYRSYKKSDGSEGALTAPKVLRFFKGEAECAAAAQSTNGNGPDWLVGNGAVNGNGHTNSAGNEVERQVALQFLPAVVQNCRNNNGFDVIALEAALRNNEILARYFTMASPEVIQAMETALNQPAF